MSSGEKAPWIDYEWAAIRVVPRVHKEEFANVGVVLHARQASFLKARLGATWREHASAIAPELDLSRVALHLDSYAAIAAGDDDAGPIALLPPSERFHWLTQPRSGILQTSPRHPGRTRDLKAELARLLVEQCEP